MTTPVRLIDTHAHLHMAAFNDDRTAVLARAAEAGVMRLVEVGYDLPSSRAAVTLAEQHDQLRAVVGIQPNHVHEAPPDWCEQVRALANHPAVVAIGEIGLDYHWMKAPIAQQAACFREQLALAREIGKPVVIHSRDAHADTVRILRESAGRVRGIMHSFSGDWDFAAACLEVGFLISFSGPVTFAKAHDLHDVARRVPLEAILTETDSPYLSPHPRRGRRNEPAHVRYVAEHLAALRGLTLPALTKAVWANAADIFAWVGT
ncbi:MAG: TatD family hydrolase [Chloroflexaceae bacterium]|nr:TatD family hydrolase [Chloroflexaceae bacterium]NJL34880.1 TatD family hydrolase [Chloroflexaceae bacterium]NJO04643.1 TatD family hydrolase [Chloroflexaceae bacterium]